MNKCYRCNEVISMCPCDESTYTADDEISRLRAELAEWKATTPAPKPDCRTCAHVYTDMESYGCKRSVIVCINGDAYVPADPVRLYETGEA